MALIDKMAMLNAPDLKRERVPVPEWGNDVEVLIQEMTALDRDRLRAELTALEGSNQINIAARVLVRCIINEDGSRVFVDAESDALGGKSQAALLRMFAVAQKLNNVFQNDSEEEGIKN